MPLQTRRPNLPSLQLPSASLMVAAGASDGFHTPIHTPLSYTPVHFSHGPLVMTPDTPAFDLAPLSALLSETDGCKAPFLSAASAAMSASTSASCADADRTFTDAEDGTIQAYLLHPPRPIRTSYPPGTLPPPGALDEITSQLVASETAKAGAGSASWRHSWHATRDRVFLVARQESMDSVGGLARPRLVAHAQSESMTAATRGPAGRLVLGGGLGGGFGGGGVAMNRQQHSIDSLYGDDAPAGGISEAMRLSSSLQTASTQGPQAVLTANSGLSSPLAFTFNFPPARKAKPYAGVAPVRPASLLQRGRSFTSADIVDRAEQPEAERAPHGLKGFTPLNDYALVVDADIDVDLGYAGARNPVRPAEMKRSVSSPVRQFVPSPPSSISSAATQSDDEDDARPPAVPETKAASATNVDVFFGKPLAALPASKNLASAAGDDDAPITPLNQMFPRYTLPAPRHGMTRSSSSNTTISSLAGAATPTAPAFTLTIDSPDQAPTPRCAAAQLPPVPGAPVQAAAHAAVPLTAPPPLHFPSPDAAPAAPAPGAADASARRVASPPRPGPLTRSLSDSTTLALASLSLSAALPRSESAYVYDRREPRDAREGGRESKRLRGAMSRAAAGQGLSVLVPRPGGMASDELRSPFEHKPVSLA